MQGLKILNLLPEGGGTCDYKGLNIDMFLPGSQIYPPSERVCYVITNQENIPDNKDIIVITTDKYEEARQKYVVNPERLPTLEEQQKQIDSLQTTVLGIMEQIAGGAAK